MPFAGGSLPHCPDNRIDKEREAMKAYFDAFYRKEDGCYSFYDENVFRECMHSLFFYAGARHFMEFGKRIHLDLSAMEYLGKRKIPEDWLLRTFFKLCEKSRPQGSEGAPQALPNDFDTRYESFLTAMGDFRNQLVPCLEKLFFLPSPLPLNGDDDPLGSGELGRPFGGRRACAKYESCRRPCPRIKCMGKGYKRKCNIYLRRCTIYRRRERRYERMIENLFARAGL